MIQAEKLEQVLERKGYRVTKPESGDNLDSIDVLRSDHLKDGLSSVEYYQNHHHHHPHYDQEAAGHHRPLNRSESIVEKVKRLLRVDSDEDTGHLHNKTSRLQYKESARDRQEKLKMFEEQLNIKINSPKKNGNLLNSYMTTSILFLSIMVLLLLSLTSRVESLESILDDIQDYVKKATKNSTELPLITDRTNPGVIKGRGRGNKGRTN